MATAPPLTNTYTAAAKLMYIKLPIYVMILMGANFRAQKSLDFQGPLPFQWPSKWICPHQNHQSRAILTTGTLIVIITNHSQQKDGLKAN
jgi:hypothetical protein